MFDVNLDPRLAEEARLWDAGMRRQMAEIFRRWSEQLLLSAEMMDVLDLGAPPPPPPSANPFSRRRR